MAVMTYIILGHENSTGSYRTYVKATRRPLRAFVKKLPNPRPIFPNRLVSRNMSAAPE